MKGGFWYHSGNFDDVSSVDDNGSPVQYEANYGGYGIIDQMLWQESEGQGLSVFLTGGVAPKNRNTVDSHLGGGINYIGLIPGRDKDQIGFAVSHASISNKKREAEGIDSGETVLEGTYRFVLNDNITLQPDIQYIIDPSADPAVKNATVVAVRFEMIY